MGRAFIIPLHIFTLSPAVFGSKDSGCDSGNPDQEKFEMLVVHETATSGRRTKNLMEWFHQVYI